MHEVDFQFYLYTTIPNLSGIENDYLDINKIIISILKTESEFINLSSEDKAFYITIDDIQTWPLFMEYRKTEEYKVLLTEIS